MSFLAMEVCVGCAIVGRVAALVVGVGHPPYAWCT